MATLTELQNAVLDISKNHYILDSSLVDITARINWAIAEIAGGLILPSGTLSPALPSLYTTSVVPTVPGQAYVDLPEDYQRSVFHVATSQGTKVPPPDNCDYYSFGMFLNAVTDTILTEAGSIYLASIKGARLYFQGIPLTSENLHIKYFRKPAPMVELVQEVPDGIPEQFQIRLIKHYIGQQLANEMVDGTDRLATYHTTEFNKAMAGLIEFIGTDDQPKARQINLTTPGA